MNSDCLMMLLQYLNIEDLRNLSDCNRQLRDMATGVIKRIFNGKLFMHLCDSPYDDKWHKNAAGLFIYDSLFALQFLRCCGDLVSQVELEPVPTRENCSLDYMQEYCSESLTDVTISRCCHAGTLIDLTKPLTKVVKVILYKSVSTDTSLQFLFPNLRHLELVFLMADVAYITTDDLNKVFTYHFPCLEHLSIEITYWECFAKEMADMVKAHPQIKSLKGNLWIDVLCDHLNPSSGTEYLLNVEKLHLTELIFFRRFYDVKRMKMRNLKELVLDIDRPIHNRPWFIPYLSDKMESLIITVTHRLNDVYFREMISKYPTARKLKFTSKLEMSHMKISEILPLLEEIDFSGYSIQLARDDVVRFVEQYHYLKLFRFCSNTQMSMTQLLTQLGSGWSVSFETHSQPDDSDNKYLSVKLER